MFCNMDFEAKVFNAFLEELRFERGRHADRYYSDPSLLELMLGLHYPISLGNSHENKHLHKQLFMLGVVYVYISFVRIAQI